ncbi:aldo/keto reductase [Dyadobacter aurulentus]|uniref:aldo/keto reductase n=1 Tax=Dyadobacter sp. UC 10 TaxID=2605428 RepID=UPI0011F3B123|nr:aldo/keto reductase [Dyadobacter sp. UC 10]KAA0988812.1 aldo/keto reductase [Dyadobacter sp. UC 10]
MKYTSFHTYKVSKLALGTVQLGMDYGIANRQGAPSVAEAHALLAASAANGINSFDTSPTYGTSEDVLGSYLAGVKKEDIFIVSKFKYDTDLASDLEKVWTEVKGIVEKSLTRLGIQKLPLILYHKGASESMEQVKNVVPELLDRLKDENLIAHGGISLYYSSEANDLLADHAFEVLQIPLNVLDQEIIANGTLQKLHDKGKLVMVRSVFLQGLFWKDPEDLSGKLSAAAPYLKKLNQLAADHRITLAELAFSFIRDLETVDSLVIGAENIVQVEANIRLLNAPLLAPELRNELLKLSTDVPIEVITPALWN